MKACYTHLCGNTRLAVVDISPFYRAGNMEEIVGYVINRVNVPKEYRRQGIGNQLMKEVMEDADTEQLYLYLSINPYGDMTYNDLELWYLRLGFMEVDTGWFCRNPKATAPPFKPLIPLVNSTK